jgi:hypothetical protein
VCVCVGVGGFFFFFFFLGGGGFILVADLNCCFKSVGRTGKADQAEWACQVFNLTSPQTVFRDIESPLKYQTRCVTAFPDATGYLVGSIEGRVAVHHVQDQLQNKNFTFKCHRDNTDVYAVNSMSFHPQVNLLAKAAPGTRH